MKNHLAFFPFAILLALSALVLPACANGKDGKDRTLLTRALTCQLKPDEVKDLPAQLKASVAGFEAPSRMLALPTMDVYKLEKPVTALGYTSSFVAIAPGMVLLAISGQKLHDVMAAQKLEPDRAILEALSITKGVREAGPNMKIIAYQRGDMPQVLAGCEYDMRDASWPPYDDDMMLLDIMNAGK